VPKMPKVRLSRPETRTGSGGAICLNQTLSLLGTVCSDHHIKVIGQACPLSGRRVWARVNVSLHVTYHPYLISYKELQKISANLKAKCSRQGR